MALSINPTDILKLLSDSKKRNREQIATWLEETAADARGIASFWNAMVNSTPVTKETAERLLCLPILANTPYVHRLHEIRESASTVLGGRVDPTIHQRVINSAGELLFRREVVKHLYFRLFGADCPLILVDDGSREEQLDELETAVALLNREAAALEILARNFRASR